MRVLVTGAAGFVGRALAAELRRKGSSDLVLTDRQISGPGTRPGDLTDEGFVSELFATGFDLVFHLASLPGAKAEADPELGHRVNLLAPVILARTAAKARRGARFVFASSIAVYGRLTAPVNDATPCNPDLTYGAHKRMTEILLNDLTRRGDLSAISLRLPGIVARPEAETGHGSAFMSQLFHKIAGGRPYDCPVPETANCWWMSRPACVAALLHAAGLDGPETVIQPPVLHLTAGAVAQAVAEVTGRRPKVTWGNDPRLTALFGALPALNATSALHLGFQSDADARTLVTNALSGGQP